MEYWYAQFLFKRGLGLVYLIAFTAALRQFRPLAGENGLTPFTEVVRRTGLWDKPSVFHFLNSDRAVKAASIVGIALSLAALTGASGMFGGLFSGAVWLSLYVLYLSIVNVGRIWYGYGWESMLLEAGFIAVFMGGFAVESSIVMILLARWMLFRVMFGAGLIKLRGDDCWKDLSCLDFHYETQPMPNPLSWFLHRMPSSWHSFETLVTHFVQLLVPLFYFAPQPFAAIAGIITIIYHLALMAGGNYSWLNLLTIVLAFSLFPDSMFAAGLKPATTSLSTAHLGAVAFFAGLVAALSYYPVRNMLSSGQRMNASFEPFKIVNTYGAFGSITRKRYEVVVEARVDGKWRECEFYGKPTDTDSMPRQYAPYHLRLDWQMWFAAMTPRPRRRWFERFMHKLAKGDDGLVGLMKSVPFEDRPEAVRARRYVYRFTAPEGLKDGQWWERELKGVYFPEISADVDSS